MISKVGSYIGGAIKNAANSKLFERGANRFDNTYYFAAAITLSSILLKDSIACVYYVKQSLDNKEIPEEKRKFIAALDLVNGFLNILTQFAAFFTLSKKEVQEKIFGKFFGKTFSKIGRNFRIKNAKKAMEEKGEKPNVRFLLKQFRGFEKNGIKALGALISLVGATIFAKRIVVPFISTPLAQWTKDNIINKGDEKENTREQKSIDRAIFTRMPKADEFRQYFMMKERLRVDDI